MNSSYSVESLDKLGGCFLVWGIFGADFYAKSMWGR